MSISEVYEKGRVAFMGVDVLVGRGALVPRAETELLGFTAVEVIGALNIAAPRIIDMCSGTANLSCGIARCLPQAQVWASDLTAEATDVARRNVQHLGLSDRVRIHQGDLFADLRGRALEGTIDAIVCNPPYISEGRLNSDRAYLLCDEPREAFDGGPYGLQFHQRVVKEAQPFLRPGGVLLFEIGLGQASQVRIIFERARAYENIHFVNDAEGNARVALARMKSA